MSAYSLHASGSSLACISCVILDRDEVDNVTHCLRTSSLGKSPIASSKLVFAVIKFHFHVEGIMEITISIFHVQKCKR